MGGLGVVMVGGWAGCSYGEWVGWVWLWWEGGQGVVMVSGWVGCGYGGRVGRV